MKRYLFVGSALLLLCALHIFFYSCAFGLVLLVSNLLLGTDFGINLAVVLGFVAFVIKIVFRSDKDGI